MRHKDKGTCSNLGSRQSASPESLHVSKEADTPWFQDDDSVPDHTALTGLCSGAGKATGLAALGWASQVEQESWALGTPGTALPRSLQPARVITWASVGTSTLSSVGATSRKAVLLHVFHQVWPGEQGEQTNHPGRRAELGEGQTKQELNHLSLPQKTLDREAPGAPHSHPMAKTRKQEPLPGLGKSDTGDTGTCSRHREDGRFRRQSGQCCALVRAA